jgi:hypothetical protein
VACNEQVIEAYLGRKKQKDCRLNI